MHLCFRMNLGNSVSQADPACYEPHGSLLFLLLGVFSFGGLWRAGVRFHRTEERLHEAAVYTDRIWPRSRTCDPLKKKKNLNVEFAVRRDGHVLMCKNNAIWRTKFFISRLSLSQSWPLGCWHLQKNAELSVGARGCPIFFFFF